MARGREVQGAEGLFEKMELGCLLPEQSFELGDALVAPVARGLGRPRLSCRRPARFATQPWDALGAVGIEPAVEDRAPNIELPT